MPTLEQIQFSTEVVTEAYYRLQCVHRRMLDKLLHIKYIVTLLMEKLPFSVDVDSTSPRIMYAACIVREGQSKKGTPAGRR